MANIYVTNGKILPIEKAQITLDSIESQYGFGVYETIKVRNNVIYFLPQHIERLFNSARHIGLDHPFTHIEIESALKKLVKEAGEDSMNIKVLLYGGESKEDATYYILPSQPFYPKRQWYKKGVSLKTYIHERWMPQAKTLNMLPSYFYYKQAKKEGHYDALLLTHTNELREGTRTNIYGLKGNTIISPPKEEILEGVTMMSLEKVIKHASYDLMYESIPLHAIKDFDGFFLTSTSSKILPIRQIDAFTFDIPPTLIRLIKLYDNALDQCKGDFERLESFAHL